jgi:hypothetical protein
VKTTAAGSHSHDLDVSTLATVAALSSEAAARIAADDVSTLATVGALSAEATARNAADKVNADAIAALAARVTALEAGPPPPPPVIDPVPTPYAATYTGSGADQTAALKTFIEGHRGQHVAISGIVPVTSLVVTVPAGPLTTVDFLPGAMVQGILPEAHGIIRLFTAFDMVWNDARVTGTGYDWVGDQDPLQNQMGMHIDGGARITLNRFRSRTVRGDGIYVGYQSGKNSPPLGVVITDPDIAQASRNGISPVAGQVAIRGGTIDRCGLFAVDFEPNDDTGARSIDGWVEGVRVTRTGDLPMAVLHGRYAIAAGGYSTAPKKDLVIRGVTGDWLGMTLRDLPAVEVSGCASDTPATVQFLRCTSTTFSGNSGMTRA